MDELTGKLRIVRAALQEDELGAVRLRGVDWFAWATCGGSSVVLLAAETGVAEVLITAAGTWVLTDDLERYRELGAEAAAAMTEVLTAARSDWTGFQLAGCGAEALWGRGIEPTLTLVGGERRLPIHRHATASGERLGRRAMLVFCAR